MAETKSNSWNTTKRASFRHRRGTIIGEGKESRFKYETTGSNFVVNSFLITFELGLKSVVFLLFLNKTLVSH